MIMTMSNNERRRPREDETGCIEERREIWGRDFYCDGWVSLTTGMYVARFITIDWCSDAMRCTMKNNNEILCGSSITFIVTTSIATVMTGCRYPTVLSHETM